MIKRIVYSLKFQYVLESNIMIKRIVYTLKFQYVLESNIMIKRIVYTLKFQYVLESNIMIKRIVYTLKFQYVLESNIMIKRIVYTLKFQYVLESNIMITRIVYTLKFQYVLESNIMRKRIAVVKSTANKNNCNSFGDSKIHIICIATSKVEMTCFVKQIGLHIKITLQAFRCMTLVSTATIKPTSITPGHNNTIAISLNFLRVITTTSCVHFRSIK